MLSASWKSKTFNLIEVIMNSRKPPSGSRSGSSSTTGETEAQRRARLRRLREARQRRSKS